MLIAVPGRWDEACFAVPAVRAMMETGIGVGVLCGAGQQAFWETLQGLAVIGLPPRTKPRVLAAGLAGKWQAAMIWEPGVAAEVCVRAKIPRRIGPNEKPLKKFLTHPVPQAAAGRPLEHRVRHYLEVVAALGLETERAGLFAPVDLKLRDPAGPALLLCPDSDFGRSHEWPLERWVEVGQALIDDGQTVAIAGLQAGGLPGGKLLDRLGGGLPYHPLGPLADALPVLAAHALVVAADGSLPHLAAHVGCTCVTLFGPNDPAWKRPLGRCHATVRRHVPCAPCFLPKCPLDARCQNELTTERVLAAIRERLAWVRSRNC